MNTGSVSECVEETGTGAVVQSGEASATENEGVFALYQAPSSLLHSSGGPNVVEAVLLGVSNTWEKLCTRCRGILGLNNRRGLLQKEHALFVFEASGAVSWPATCQIERKREIEVSARFIPYGLPDGIQARVPPIH